MYQYPTDEEINGGDIIKWFCEVFKEAYGSYPPSKDIQRYAGFISSMRKKGLSNEEIMTLVWGVTNEKSSKIRSIFYCQYFIDELPKYKKLREEIDNRDDDEDEREFVKININKEDEGEDFFAELL